MLSDIDVSHSRSSYLHRGVPNSLMNFKNPTYDIKCENCELVGFVRIVTEMPEVDSRTPGVCDVVFPTYEIN